MQLKGKPWQVLKALAEAPEYTRTQQQLLDSIWSDTAVEPATVTKTVERARTALRNAGADGDPIVNVDDGEQCAWRLNLS